MKLSARNILKGKIKRVEPGAVNTEVTIELSGGAEVVSVITATSSQAQEHGQNQRCDHDHGCLQMSHI